MQLQVGNVITNVMPLLGNNIGTKGVVYEVYQDFDESGKQGASIIFENGNYDGFSYEEQQIMLNVENIKNIPLWIREYQFENVMKLSKDYKNGIWNAIFK